MAKDIIVFFPPLAGGKFIGNCLFLSKHCWLPYIDRSETLIDCPENYDLRLELTLSSLPSAHQMTSWLNYEYKEYRNYPDLHARANGKNLRCIGTLHELDENFLSKDQQDLVRLINYHKFRLKAKKLKQCHPLQSSQNIARYTRLKGDSWPSFSEFQLAGFNTKLLSNKYNDNIISEINDFYPAGRLDNNYFLFNMINLNNWRVFKTQLENLYLQLNLSDFNEKIVKPYYDAYIGLHFS